MNFLKGLALGLLSFLLFLSLSIFGLVFMLNSTVLNPNFITAEINRLDVSTLVKEVEEVLSEQMGEEEFPEELTTTMIATIDKLEAPVKEQVSAAIHSTYDYLLGKRQSPDLAVTLGDTFLSSDFVASVMDELDLASLTEVILSEQMGEEEFPEELKATLVNTITEIEPLIKQRIVTAADPIFDYLLGKSESIDLALTLRNTILTSDFVSSLLEELDISSLASEFLGEQLAGEIPQEMEFLIESLDDVIAELEPMIERELIAAADPILDYLLGQRQSFSISISMEPVIETLKDTLREPFLESPPAEFAALPRGTLERYFDEYFEEFTEMIPATFELDETLFPAEIPAQIAEAIAEAEAGLEEARQGTAEVIAEAEEGLEPARQYVGYFQLGYKLLIVFMLLLVLGFVLISREVKYITRRLGIPLLTYGALWYAGIFVAKYFAVTQLPLPEIPASLQTWMTQLIENSLAPMQTLSLGLLIGGIALIVVSFVYKPRQPSPED